MNAYLKGLAVAAATAWLALSPPVAIAQEPRFSSEETAAIEEIVRNYLIQNPEIMREVFAELERRQQAAQQLAQEEALRDAQDALFAADDVVLGNPEGDVTLVEFFDYNCGFCKRALDDVQQLIEADPNLRVVVKDFPVLGPGSLEAARIGLAAKQQFTPEQNETFHVRLMQSRGQINGERATALAVELGADRAKLEADVNSDAVRDIIAENVDLGDKLGLTGTPAWVIGDRVISGAIGTERLAASIANVRKCGTATC
jgi:protein-disulfide isomerase